MGGVGEWWARTFEPEGAGGFAGYGGEAERREATKTEEVQGPIRAAEAKLVEDQANAASKAQKSVEDRKRRLIVGSKTVFSSPLGIAGTASIARKTLLGQ